MSYQQLLNGHALGALHKPPRIPDYHLMVGSAERLESLPLLVSTATYSKDVAKMITKTQQLSEEEVTEKLTNNLLEVNDFIENTALIGSGL